MFMCRDGALLSSPYMVHLSELVREHAGCVELGAMPQTDAVSYMADLSG
jgi:hypothetical protein